MSSRLETVLHKESTPKDTRRRNFGRIVGNLGLLLVVILFSLVMSLLSPVFLSWTNLTNLLVQSTILMTLALGQTFVIMTRGIDLSIGGIMALSSCVGLGAIVSSGANPWLGMLVMLAIGIILGALNGLAITKIGITPLIVTLAMLGVCRGAVFIYTDGANITPVPDVFRTIGSGKFAGLPVLVLIVMILALAAHVILSSTVFGRSVYATGGNEVASRLAGIRTDRVTVAAYCISGLCAAIAGLLETSRLESAGPRAGTGIELTVIAAAVIGGTSLFGGQGSVPGTLLGVILISLVSNAVNLLEVPPAWDELVKGVVIFLAAMVDVYRRKYAISSSRGARTS